MGYTYDPNGTAYRLHGSKHSCPSCGHRTLQLYEDAATGEPINDQVGKCDRHYNCGYDYKPMQYYNDHPEELPPAKDGRRRNYHPEPQKSLVIIPKDYVVKSIIPTAKNGLCGFVDILLQMFAPSDVKRVIDLYYLGHSKFGAVIFWQIDTKGRVREGKAMQYNVHNGRREKASWVTGESFWIFSTLQARGVLPTPATSTKCMFGEHLLRNASASSIIYITEGEKNAIFGALAMPDSIWLAVGSSQDFGKVRNVKDILEKCGSVVFVPDADAIADWRKKAQRLNLHNAKVSNLCAGHADGWDLADIIRDIYLQHPQQFKPTQRREPTPAPTPMVEVTPNPTPKAEPSATPIFHKTPLFPKSHESISESMTEAEFEMILSPEAIKQAQTQPLPF
jgi:hypothetical protein